MGVRLGECDWGDVRVGGGLRTPRLGEWVAAPTILLVVRAGPLGQPLAFGEGRGTRGSPASPKASGVASAKL